MHTFSQVCPGCLTEKGYLDYTLDFWHVPICSEHRRLLVDTCPRCKKLLSCDRASLFHCGECGMALRAIESSRVSGDLCAVARQVTALRPIFVVASNGHAALEPSHVAALIAHLASGEHVFSIAKSLPPRAVAMPVAERLVGFSALAKCMDGSAIHANDLKTAIIDRSRYLLPFRATPFFEWWLRSGLQCTDLELRAANALAFDSADETSHMAIHRVSDRGEKAASAAEVRARLGATPYEFDELTKWTSLAMEYRALSYDADELASAESFYRGCLTEQELDSCFGIPGLTAQLLSHGKLQEFAPRVAPPRRISPEGLNAFLSSLERHVPRIPVGDGAPSVSSAVEGDAEPARRAAMLLMRCGEADGLAAGWASPFRLADVLCRADLTARP